MTFKQLFYDWNGLSVASMRLITPPPIGLRPLPTAIALAAAAAGFGDCH